MFHQLRQFQGNAVYNDIAPYIVILTEDVRGTVNSINRSDAAAAILHRHGKHTQRELFNTLPPGQANPPGFSSHELKSDSLSRWGFPRGADLLWWQQGFDVNDGEVAAFKRAAQQHGWVLWQPYPGTVEFHHLNFARRPSRPRVGSRDWRRLWTIRTKLPKQ